MPTFPIDNNMTGITDLLANANTMVDGFLGTGILIVIAVISFIASKAVGSMAGFGFSAFLTLLTAVVLFFMGLISNKVLYIGIIYFVAVLIWMFIQKESEQV